MIQRRHIIFLIPLAAAVVSSIVLYLALVKNWFGPGLMTDLGFCEALSEKIVKQPANSWSNISFVVSGIYIGWESMKNKYELKNNLLTRTIFFPTFLATLTVLLGPGSMAMHASTAQIGGYFDMLSMYLLASFMFAYALMRILDFAEVAFVSFFILAMAVCHIVHFNDGPLFGFIYVTVIFGFFVVSATILEYANYRIKKPNVDVKWVFIYSFNFLLSFLIWNLSLTGNVLCDPGSLIQGHAIWHIMNAGTVYFIFRYYVSEDRRAVQ